GGGGAPGAGPQRGGEPVEVLSRSLNRDQFIHDLYGEYSGRVAEAVRTDSDFPVAPGGPASLPSALAAWTRDRPPPHPQPRAPRLLGHRHGGHGPAGCPVRGAAGTAGTAPQAVPHRGAAGDPPLGGGLRRDRHPLLRG